jgi:hypothetical protein
VLSQIVKFAARGVAPLSAWAARIGAAVETVQTEELANADYAKQPGKPLLFLQNRTFPNSTR